MLQRPIQHLYPLEISKDEDFKEIKNTCASEDIWSLTQSTKYERPIRAAAKVVQEWFKD